MTTHQAAAHHIKKSNLSTTNQINTLNTSCEFVWSHTTTATTYPVDGGVAVVDRVAGVQHLRHLNIRPTTTRTTTTILSPPPPYQEQRHQCMELPSMLESAAPTHGVPQSCTKGSIMGWPTSWEAVQSPLSLPAAYGRLYCSTAWPLQS